MTPRIVDAVYASTRPGPRARVLVAVLVAVAMHAAVIAYAARMRPGLGAWSASLALRVHDELGHEDVVTLEEAPPPPPLPEPAPPAPKAAKAAGPAKKPTPAPVPAALAPVAASAAPLVTSEAPVDFSTFVTGSGERFAGGSTQADGASNDPVAAAVASAPDRSVAVRLSREEWSCPWPQKAVSELVDEQSVVIRVLVREDGSVVDAKVVRDAPGGFGAAALQCAKTTGFLPARSRDGAVIRAWSPEIEVRFWR